MKFHGKFKYVASSVYVWTAYCVTVGVFFTILKCVNLSLHHMYDTSEYIVEEEDDRPECERRRQPLSSASRTSLIRHSIVRQSVSFDTSRDQHNVTAGTSGVLDGPACGS
ncbi:hypothetical protein J6590_003126 [Homalodisca vitripennis]|nr:hypothetical protein J6590_003126 [Homalodisca vitripennis]